MRKKLKMHLLYIKRALKRLLRIPLTLKDMNDHLAYMREQQRNRVNSWRPGKAGSKRKDP